MRPRRPAEGPLFRRYGRSHEQIAADTLSQIHELFPSSRELECTWSNVVKLGQSLYRARRRRRDRFSSRGRVRDQVLSYGRAAPARRRRRGSRAEAVSPATAAPRTFGRPRARRKDEPPPRPRRDPVPLRRIGEKPGQDKHRPSQATPIPNFFLAGSYTYQDYIDSMEGATKSGLMCADEIVAAADAIAREAKTNLPVPEGKVGPKVPGRGPLDMTAAVSFVDDGSFDTNENTDMSMRPSDAPAIDSL